MHLNRDRYNSDDWVPIDTRIIQQVFGDLKFYYPIIKKLIEDGYVEVLTNNRGSQSYSTGKSCKKYRLSTSLNEMEWKCVTVFVENCTTTDKVARFYQKDWQEIDRQLYVMLQKFNIDRIPFFEDTTCLNFAESDYAETEMFRKMAENKIALNLRKRKRRRKGLTVERSMKEIYSAYKGAYLQVREGGAALRHKADELGRRHTNITNLPKWLRGKLYVFKDGEKRYLKEVDVKNSQVLLLLTLIDKNTDGYDEFKNLVETGLFYEFLAERMGVATPLSADGRVNVKQRFFKFIYGKNKNYVLKSKVAEILKDKFPEIVRLFISFKKKYGHKAPARRMQRAESDIIIHYVAKTAVKKTFVFTQVYDSILCLEEDVETFDCLIREGYKAHGLSAATNITIDSQHNQTSSRNAPPEFYATNTGLAPFSDDERTKSSQSKMQDK